MDILQQMLNVNCNRCHFWHHIEPSFMFVVKLALFIEMCAYQNQVKLVHFLRTKSSKMPLWNDLLKLFVPSSVITSVPKECTLISQIVHHLPHLAIICSVHCEQNIEGRSIDEPTGTFVYIHSSTSICYILPGKESFLEVPNIHTKYTCIFAFLK